MPSEDYSGSVKLNISGASESFVAWLLADLLHLIGGGIVGSMPSSRTQQQAADLFQAAGAQESCRTHTPARLTSAQQSAAVALAERPARHHPTPRSMRRGLVPRPTGHRRDDPHGQARFPANRRVR